MEFVTKCLFSKKKEKKDIILDSVKWVWQQNWKSMTETMYMWVFCLGYCQIQLKLKITWGTSNLYFCLVNWKTVTCAFFSLEHRVSYDWTLANGRKQREAERRDVYHPTSIWDPEYIWDEPREAMGHVADKPTPVVLSHIEPTPTQYSQWRRRRDWRCHTKRCAQTSKPIIRTRRMNLNKRKASLCNTWNRMLANHVDTIIPIKRSWAWE